MDYYQLENNREDLISLLIERKHLLEQLLLSMKRTQPKHPGGMLRTSRNKHNYQYYWKESADDFWVYLPKKHRKKAEAIINAEYAASVITQISAELKSIQKYLSFHSPRSLDDQLNKLSEGRKALIQKIIPSDEEFLQSFLSINYESLQIHPENKQFPTSKGDYVRSKAEWMISERLNHFKIPYHYDFPVELNGYGTVYTDFFCLNARRRMIIPWEHLGMMGNEDYATPALKKMHAYEENGYIIGKNLIITEESSGCPLVPSTIDHWIERMLL